jgi:uncharacterized protein (TIGR03067 family)
MFQAAEELRFEYAAKLRDEIKDLARDLARMAGSWTLDLPEGQATLTFKADKLDVKAPNRTYSVTLTLDPEASPHPAVDFHVDEGPDDARGQTNQAIYKFEGEELTLCVDGGAGERPTSFRTAEGTSYEFRLNRKP